MKNKLKNILIIFLINLFWSSTLIANEFNLVAETIKIYQAENKIIAEGNVVSKDINGNTILSDKATYLKNKNFLIAENNVTATNKEGMIIKSQKLSFDKKKNLIIAENFVEVIDSEANNKIMSNKINYFKNNEIIVSEGKTIIYLKSDYEINSYDIKYNMNKEVISSKKKTNVNDKKNGTVINLENFKYKTIKEELRSNGDIKIFDKENNIYFADNIFLDAKKNKISGTNLKVVFDKNLFDIPENDPRLFGNTAELTSNISTINKGGYTTCKKNNDECPSWKITASEIIHDKNKKKITYKNAWLNLFDIPVFYFPKFFHPDPTVKRQSGFLSPTLASSVSSNGSAINLPYYFALSENRDLTFKPKFYTNDNPLFQTEYRHVTKNTKTLIDFSYNEGYKNNSSKKSSGSRNHLFATSDIDLNFDSFDTSELKVKLQKVNNDTYLRVHNIKSDENLISSYTQLNSAINLKLKKESSSFDLDMNIYENLSNTNNRYEYVLPSFDYQNELIESEAIGTVRFQSRGSYKKYNTNVDEAKFVNDVYWLSNDVYSNFGLVSQFEGNLKNSNYDADKTTTLKNENTNFELAGAISMTNSFPLEKNFDNSRRVLTPKIMTRFSPSHMRNLNSDGLKLDSSNLYVLNKVGEIDVLEKGSTITLGGDYKILNLNNEYNFLDFSLGQVFNLDANEDLPKSSSLNKKSSDLVGYIDFGINENGNIKYSYSFDNNYDTLNYNEIAATFQVNKLITDFSYFEERNFIGSNHYANLGFNYLLDETKKINFKTRKDFNADATEFINWNFEYENDCLRAALEFNRTFYKDRDIEPDDEIFLNLTFVPFGQFNSPAIQTLK